MKQILFPLIFIIPLLLQQCSQPDNNPVSVTDKSKTVEIAIVTKPGFDTIASSAMVEVSGEGMQTMHDKLMISDSSITGRIEKIPLGKNRLFQVYVYDVNGHIIYEGSDNVDIFGGVTHVSIFLHKVVDGVAVIDGKIEDSSDFTPIAIGHSVSLSQWDSTTQTSKIWVSAWAYAPGSDFPQNPFEYSCTYKGFPESGYDTWQANMIGKNLSVPWEGELQMIVSVRYRVHPEIIKTQTINIFMENGYPTDLDQPIPPPPQHFTDTVRYQLGPNDSVNVPFKCSNDTISISATGTWCMNKDLCCSAGGDSTASKKQFIQPGFYGGALLASLGYNSDIIYIGTSKDIIATSYKAKSVLLFANKFRPQLNGNESGKIDLVVIQKGWM